MIDYTDIIIEAYQDNHIEFLGIWHNKKYKLSLKTNLIDVLYLEWFIPKMQIIERDYFIENDTFINKCVDANTLVCGHYINDKSNKETLVEYSFILITLANLRKAIDDETKRKQHSFPTIDKNLFDADWIFDNYHGKTFKGSKECFDAWLVDGFEHPDKLEWILSRREGKPNKAQLRLFINTITNSDTAKDGYFKNVWGIEIKTASIDVSKSFDNKLKDLKKKHDENRADQLKRKTSIKK